MKISKHDIQKWFSEALELFNDKIIKSNYNIAVNFLDDDEFIEIARAVPMNEMMINMGAFKDFDDNYPSFASVSSTEKNMQMMSELFNFIHVMKINISLDRANKFLSCFKRNEIHEYIIYAFIHELVHLHEDILMIKYDECYDALLHDYSKEFAQELFAEVFTNKFCKLKIIDPMYEKMYHKIMPNYNKIVEKDKNDNLDKYIELI